MKKILLFAAYAIGLQLFSTAHAQGYMKLATQEVVYEGTYQKEEGQKFFAAKDTTFSIHGGEPEDKLHLKKLELYNTSFTSARLVVEFEAASSTYSFVDSPGDFFITISFCYYLSLLLLF